MENNRTTTINEAVHKIQLALLDGIRDQGQLFAAGSLMSQSDYEDVVTERSIANTCGYPLCGNPLPSERSRKGRYHISLKEHKVYDLEETYLYCSTGCVVNSCAFSASLPSERCFTFNFARINEVLSLFEAACSDAEEEGDLKKDVSLGLGNLKIQENTETEGQLVSLEEWAGPSNAIEGYIPRQDCNTKPSSMNTETKGSELSLTKMKKDKGIAIEEMGFNSVIITGDEFSVSKNISLDGEAKHLPSKFKKVVPSEKPSQNGRQSRKTTLKSGKDAMFTNMDFTSEIITQDEYSVSKFTPETSKDDSNAMPRGVKGETKGSVTRVKSSLKSSRIKGKNRTVTWADEKSNSASGSSNLCEYKELESAAELPSKEMTSIGDEDDLRFVSANACAEALTQAATAVVSGNTDVAEAVSAAGIVLIPEDAVQNGTECAEGEQHDVKAELGKWPKRSTIPEIDGFDTDDSWFDSPPDGFSLTLSPFAMMWNAVFSWITSSSLAYIYGKDDSHQEEYLNVSGREYLKKVMLSDGRSSEIKQTMAACLARALPGVISDLKLATPISTLEQRIACLLDTMSFLEALPPFRMKQWQVIAILFIEAVSVCRIPGLGPQLSSKRVSMSKVLEGAKVSMQEYESMKDIVLPLSRVPL